MLPDGGSPADWLRHARSDVALSRTATGADVLLEALCFHAQQAAEKALKAVLVAHNLRPPRTHNLRVLVELLPDEVPVPTEAEEAAALTDYAVMARYPGEHEPVEPAEREHATRLAESIVNWAETQVALIDD